MAEEKSAGVKINKAAIVLITGIASLIGTMPVFLFLEHPSLIPYSALFALIIATIVVFTASHKVEEKPPFGAFLLAGCGEVSRISLPCLVFFAIYYLTYSIAWLVTYLAFLLGPKWNVNLDHIAFYPSIVFSGLGAIAAIVVGTRKMINQLYPTAAETKHAFFVLLTSKRSLLIKWTIWALVILAVLFISSLIVTGGLSKVFIILLQLYFAYVALPLLLPPSGSRRRRPPQTEKAIEALGKLLGAAGFKVISSPETGDARIDPILRNIDLFAYNDEKALVLNVKYNMPKDPVRLVDALNVLTAARSLSLSSKELEIPTDNVIPVLLAIEGHADESIVEYAQKASVKIIEANDKDINTAISFKNDQADESREMALRVFGNLLEKQGG